MGDIVLSFATNDKVPGYVAEVNYGRDAKAGQATYKLLVCGMAGATGTITADGPPVPVPDKATAASLFDSGTEGYDMCVGALEAMPGVELWACSPTVASGNYGAATITIGGSWTTAGTWRGRVGGFAISYDATATDDETTFATAACAYWNTLSHLPATFANVAGVITATLKTKGVRQNALVLWQDTSEVPSGMTSALAGGAATASGGVRFASGTGTEDVTDQIAALDGLLFDTIAVAQQDATNLALWETFVDAAAGPLEGRSSHVVLCMTNATQTGVTSIAQTTLDDQRFEVLWQIDGETRAATTAARFAAVRNVTEMQNPNPNYDGFVLDGVQPSTDANGRFAVMSRSTKVAALNAGITPIETKQATGAVQIVRAVTTRTLDADGNIDDATVDVGHARTPDRVRKDLEGVWNAFRVANPRVRDDASSDADVIPAGVAYPALWNQGVFGYMLEKQQLGWVTDVGTEAKTTPKSSFSRAAGRIVSRVPVVCTPLNHQMELAVDQIPYSSL